jgi:hypothetical protein
MLDPLTTRRLYPVSSHDTEVVWCRLTTRRLYAGSSHHAEVVCWSASQRKAAPGLLTPSVRFVCAFPLIKKTVRRSACRNGYSESLF